MAPMPNAVSDQGPSVFCRRWPGASDSAISLSIDLQQKSCLSEVRITSAGSVMIVTSGCGLLKQLSAVSLQLSAGCPDRYVVYRTEWGLILSKRGASFALPLCLAAGQFLDLGLFRSASVVAGLERFFRLALLAGGAFGFLAFLFGQLCCVCHECVYLSSSRYRLLVLYVSVGRDLSLLNLCAEPGPSER